jgi:peroxiredoxin
MSDQQDTTGQPAGTVPREPEQDIHPSAASPAASEDPPPGRGRWMAAAAAALGVALFAVPLLRGPGASTTGARPTAAAADGTPMCAESKGTADLGFTMKDVDGRTVRLLDYKGQVILLNFWATWCGPCKIEIPEFVDAYAEYRDRGFVILGVLSQDDPSAEDLRAFASEWRMNYPILRENTDLDDAFGPLWAIPTSFIIDRHGSICTKHLGPVSKEVLEQEIKRLL